MEGGRKVVKNLITGDALYDTLHKSRRAKQLACDRELCMGSSMSLFGKASKRVSGNKPEIKAEAKEFLESFHQETGRKDQFPRRWSEVEAALDSDGFYNLSAEELEFGARTAWRNAPRCPGRIQWKNLKLFDRRDVSDLDAVFKYICEHVEYSTNNGSIRPTISVFPQRKPGEKDKVRIWNKLLISYAGYVMEDGSVIGDRGSIDFTKFCQRLGWRAGPERGMFDILPIVLSGEDGEPKFFELPKGIIKMIRIRHPDYKSIDDLNLRWHALPAVCAMLLEVGGSYFPCVPFSGWYSLPEIATRDLLDPMRYDLIKPVAEALKLDTHSLTNLWKDKVNTELSVAVLHSYVADGVALVDHHSQADQFMDHFRQEHNARGGCPADWVWIVPPTAGGLTKVFHQEMLCYHLTPCYDYQEDLTLSYRFPGDKERVSFRGVLKALFFCGTLLLKQYKKRSKALVVYGTETGTSKRYAENLRELLSHKFYAVIRNIDGFTVDEMRRVSGNNTLVFFVASTFGNGGPPTDAKAFAGELAKLSEDDNNNSNNNRKNILLNLKYAILGLGNSSYPYFCAFAKTMDSQLASLGGKRILELGLCDELAQPEKTFKTWLDKVNALDSLNLNISLSKVEVAERKDKRRLFKRISSDNLEFFRNMRQLKGNTPFKAQLTYRHNESQRVILVRLDVTKAKQLIAAGDHLAIIPENDPNDIEELMRKVGGVDEENVMLGKLKGQTSIKSVEAMLRSYYELKASPTQAALAKLESYASETQDRDRLRKLALDDDAYREWSKEMPGWLDTLKEFSSVRLTLQPLVELLGTIKPRWYSVASSPSFNVDVNSPTVDLVVSVIRTETPGGRIKKGFCSGYLNSVAVGSNIICIHRSMEAMRRCLDEDRPVLMVASGSGIAPFRGLWQEMMFRKVSPSKTLLIFGCRDDDEDLFRGETALAIRRVAAFSRKAGHPKMYAQDKLEEMFQDVVDIVFKQGGSMLVCGSVSMADGVNKKFRSLISRHFDGLGEKDAERKLEDLTMQGRYVEEIFGAEEE